MHTEQFSPPSGGELLLRVVPQKTKMGIDFSRDLCYNIPCVQVMVHILGCRQAVRHQTLTLAFVGSNPAIPAKYDPLAQPVEQLPFKQWVRGSSPRRVTKQAVPHLMMCDCLFFAFKDGTRTFKSNTPGARPSRISRIVPASGSSAPVPSGIPA